MISSEINPWSLPKAPISHKDFYPSGRGVYFALLNEQVMYIGIAENIRQRWRAHHREADLSACIGIEIAWIVVSPDIVLAKLERELIDIFHPVLNDGPVFDKKAVRRGRTKVTTITVKSVRIDQHTPLASLAIARVNP